MKMKSVKLKDGYVLKELGGEFCIFDESDSQNGSLDGLPSVNETCIFLWNHLESGESIEELIKNLSIKNEIDEMESEIEVQEFLAKLIHANIIEFEK